MDAEIFLSRTAYRAGTPVVGSVRIRCTDDANNANHKLLTRSTITSARLYLTGQAHLRPGSSSWRSNKEISKLKSLYGEHACLTFASLQEQSRQDNGLSLIEQADRIALHLRMHNQQEFRSQLPVNDLHQHQEEDAICFWMTNVLDLMDVPENDVGEQIQNVEAGGQEMVPNGNRHTIPRKPLKLPDHNTLCRVLNARHDALNETFEVDSLESSDDESSSVDTERSISDNTTTHGASTWDQIMASAKSETKSATQQQAQSPEGHITITFRSNLPEDIPPTISAECVKYFYSAVLVVTTKDGELVVSDCPFTVLTCNTSNFITHVQSANTSSTRVHIGELYAMAHSSSLPCILSPMEVLGERQLHVISDPPACSIVSRMTAERRTSTHRIQDENGALCAWLTLVGVGGPIAPGTRLGIVVRFPNVDDEEEVGQAGTVSCHRVCCALVGQEYALCEGAAVPMPSPAAASTKRKTRSYVFDSAYEMVEFGCTNSISMGLLLPVDCPITVKTDLVEVAVSLKLEFTVDRAVAEPPAELSNDETETGFGVIRLELPVEVIHDDERVNEEEEEDAMAVQNQLAAISRFWITNDASTCEYFDQNGIHEDLKTLSLRLMK